MHFFFMEAILLCLLINKLHLFSRKKHSSFVNIQRSISQTQQNFIMFKSVAGQAKTINLYKTK